MAVPYETQNAIRNDFAVPATGWTDLNGLTTGVSGDVVLPVSCNQIEIYNNSTSDVLMRTDPGNAASQITIAAGATWIIGTPQAKNVPPRFPVGFQNVVASFQSTSGTVDLTLVSIP